MPPGSPLAAATPSHAAPVRGSDPSPPPTARHGRRGRPSATAGEPYMPARPLPLDHTVAIRTGYWFEALCYRDARDRPPELLDRAMLDTPEEAVRRIRLQIRTAHPFALSPTEVHRALTWADGGGRIHTLAALHRGETAGFSIVLRGGLRPEWRVRPVDYLSLTPTPTGTIRICVRVT
ncbi:predicted protein [Streptomyces sp. C]|nr:predicted protein [Streptomyces sp. C]